MRIIAAVVHGGGPAFQKIAPRRGEAEDKVRELDTKQEVEEEFDAPANVTVLKNLISQLPPGITKQTGAQLISQTMSALGIPIKGVLQEAQQFQENLVSLSDECKANIAECKSQISAAEAQIKKIQKQCSALNDIISLFVQTT